MKQKPPPSGQARAAESSVDFFFSTTEVTRSAPAGQAAIPFPAHRRPVWLERRLRARLLAEALERLADSIRQMESRRGGAL